jgi:hypothetical protein
MPRPYIHGLCTPNLNILTMLDFKARYVSNNPGVRQISQADIPVCVVTDVKVLC